MILGSPWRTAIAAERSWFGERVSSASTVHHSNRTSSRVTSTIE